MSLTCKVLIKVAGKMIMNFENLYIQDYLMVVRGKYNYLEMIFITVV